MSSIGGSDYCVFLGRTGRLSLPLWTTACMRSRLCSWVTWFEVESRQFTSCLADEESRLSRHLRKPLLPFRSQTSMMQLHPSGTEDPSKSCRPGHSNPASLFPLRLSDLQPASHSGLFFFFPLAPPARHSLSSCFLFDVGSTSPDGEVEPCMHQAAGVP